MRAIETAVLFTFGAVGCSNELVRLGDGPTGPEVSAAGAGTVIVPGGYAGWGGASGALVGSGGNTAGSGGLASSAVCQHGQVNADEVLWIGDSWVTIPGTQQTAVRDYARAAGAIGRNDEYVVSAVAASTLSKIVVQYEDREAGSVKVKVLVMDGGTWDTYLSSGADASITKVSNIFEQFLAKVATDGTVQHIIYFLVPELSTVPGIAELRTHLQQACAESKVPCHFLDLQLLWEGHPEYTADDGFQASDTGATVIADSIWKIMQQNCIAQ